MLMKREIASNLKSDLLPLFGGGCQHCGYNKCLRALQFHHRDPLQKEDRKYTGQDTLREARAHPDRFILLCANCHFEEHERIDASQSRHNPCLNCGAPMRVEAARLANNRDKFCSKACQSAFRLSQAVTTAAITARLMKKIHKTPTCWEWTGSDNNGTPVLNVTSADGKHAPHSARRLVYEAIAGPLRPDQTRLQRICNNPRCVRPHPQHITPIKL